MNVTLCWIYGAGGPMHPMPCIVSSSGWFL